MIVKFFSRGGGSARASVDYLLGKDRNRSQARILQGSPELTHQLADSLDFKRRFTVGCLSFKEKDLPEKAKREIMAGFEQTLLAGLESNQYDILWVEHQDKDRLELNFLIPNIELSTGKRLQPYYDQADRGLVSTWRDIINHDYGLHDPQDPANRQSLVTTQDLPKEKQKFQKALTSYLEQKILAGEIKNRDDVLTAIQSLGLEISRATKQSISIKNPDGGQNIRLKGEIYEQAFRTDGNIGAENRAKSERYRAENQQRIDGIRAEYHSRLGAKTKQHQKQYSSVSRRNQRVDFRYADYADGISQRNTGFGDEFISNVSNISREFNYSSREFQPTAGANVGSIFSESGADKSSQFAGNRESKNQSNQELHEQQLTQQNIDNYRPNGVFSTPIEHDNHIGVLSYESVPRPITASLERIRARNKQADRDQERRNKELARRKQRIEQYNQAQRQYDTAVATGAERLVEQQQTAFEIIGGEFAEAGERVAKQLPITNQRIGETKEITSGLNQHRERANSDIENYEQQSAGNDTLTKQLDSELAGRDCNFEIDTSDLDGKAQRIGINFGKIQKRIGDIRDNFYHARGLYHFSSTGERLAQISYTERTQMIENKSVKELTAIMQDSFARNRQYNNDRDNSPSPF